MEKILRVISGKASYTGSKPSSLAIFAIGEVTSPGWSSPLLAALRYVVAPTDGIQDFDFYAERPTSNSRPFWMPAVAEVTATCDIENYWGEGKPLRGARIHSGSNDIELQLEEKDEKAMSEGLPLPWPFPWGSAPKSADQSLSPLRSSKVELPSNYQFQDLIGCTLRAYKTGDMITKDKRHDRANIEINPATERIAFVWIG